MTSRQYKWALLVLGVAGLVGGTLGSWLLPGRAAFAQEEALQVVTAKEFRLVDEAGRCRASLALTWICSSGGVGVRARAVDCAGLCLMGETGKRGLSIWASSAKHIEDERTWFLGRVEDV